MHITPTLRRSRQVLTLATTTLLAIGSASCGDDAAPTQPAAAGSSTVPATAPFGDSGTPDSGTPGPGSDASALTADEIAGLEWIREEEQLAHDVYVALGDLWGLRIFENIASSETAHIDAVSDLLDRYGIDDPAQGNEPGTFTNPEIQALHDRLVADGSASLEAALKVGAVIEELDISDLQARAAATDVPAITTVYNNLERGSRNHLRAFASQLESRGVAYEPTELEPSVFDAIVSSETERGHDG